MIQNVLKLPITKTSQDQQNVELLLNNQDKDRTRVPGRACYTIFMKKYQSLF